MNKQDPWTSSAEIRGRMQRYTNFGASIWELLDIYGRIKGPDDWYREFTSAAKQFEKAADHIKDNFVKAATYMKAVVYYNAAQVDIELDTEERKQAYQDMARVYQQAGKYLKPPIEVVRYPFMGITLSAYFRKAINVIKPPCVILVRGLDAPSEIQDHLFSEYLLERGLSTLAIDCPPQSGSAIKFPGSTLTLDLEKPVGAAVDYLETRTDIDPNKIGIVGVSFGGYSAPRAASLEKRIKACVCVAGFYSLSDYELRPRSLSRLLHNIRATEAEWPMRRKQFTLEGIINQMTCHLLVVNGSLDSLTPTKECIKIYEHARCPKELKIYDGYGHCAYNQDKGVIASIADWLSAKLRGSTYSPTDYLTFTLGKEG